MKTFVKVFSESGYGGESRLENQINEVAERGNLDIVSAEPCFKNGLTTDTLFVVVVYRQKAVCERKAIENFDSQRNESTASVNEILENVEQALLKQTKKRPDYEGDGYADGYLVYDTAYCPECRHPFEEGVNDWGSNFCPDCGQALDWSDGTT